MAYTYDANGDMITYTNAGWAKTFTQAFDANGRFYNLSTNWIDATHPGGLAHADWSTTSPYAPNGALRSLQVWNNLEENIAFDNRNQPCRMNVNSSNTMVTDCGNAVPSGNVLDLQAGFNYGATDNGSVTSWTATGNQTFNRTYTYDSLNRLKTMADSTTAQPCKGLSWTYDAWGNRTDQTVTSGTCNTFHATVGTNNRLSGSPYAYDAAGNLTNDGSHAYTYDAENRLTQVDGTPGSCSTATACYVYDAFGQRARKTVGTYVGDYFYNADGLLDSLVENSSASRGFVYVNGRFTVAYANNNTYFVHQDHLGSTRLLTNWPTPTVAESDDYYPFGEFNASGTTIPLKFTGDERDTETGLDNTQFRKYASAFGRWTSPDPLPGSIGDPQSLNRYAYVGNRPLTFTDPRGLRSDPVNHPRLFSTPCNSDFGEICTSLNTFGVTENGYDIFDAIAGAPGTYTYHDEHANLGFGFSYNPYDDPSLAAPRGAADYTITVYCDEFDLLDISCNAPPQAADGSRAWYSPFYNADEARLAAVGGGVVAGAGVIGDLRYIAGFYVASAGSALIDVTIADYSAGPLQSTLFGRFASQQGGGFPGFLNDPSYLVRLGFGWNAGQMVFRLGWDFFGGGHLDFWNVPWP